MALIAPEGFLEEAVSENVMAGNVMSRRASYMYGMLLRRDPKGTLGSSGFVSSTPSLTKRNPRSAKVLTFGKERKRRPRRRTK